MVSTDLLEQLKWMAATSWNKEICGLIDSAGDLYEITNVSPTPHISFSMHKGEYHEALTNIYRAGRHAAWIYHSHTAGTPDPTPADRKSFEQGTLSWLIVTAHDYRTMRK